MHEKKIWEKDEEFAAWDVIYMERYVAQIEERLATAKSSLDSARDYHSFILMDGKKKGFVE